MKDFEKKILNEAKKAFEKLEFEIEAPGIENPKFFDDFDSKEFEFRSREYVDAYKDEISEFANEIYSLNEDPKARKNNARILFCLLYMGFSTYIQSREGKEKAILEDVDAIDTLGIMETMNIISHQPKEAVNKFQTQIGAICIETRVSFDDLDSVEFENHCVEYIDFYREEISEFANIIYFLNENSETRKEHARTIFSLLHVGFNTYLKARRDNVKDKAEKE